MDDAPLGDAIARAWHAVSEKELNVQGVTQAELSQASRLPADVVVFPAGELGTLVERDLVQQLNEKTLEDMGFDRRDIFDQVRLREIVWGNKLVAVPLGSPRLLLVYRRDLFDKLALAPPQTWKDYQAVVERLAAEGKLASEGKAEHAVIEPLADGWAGQMLLARAAAYVSHRDQVSSLFDYQTFDPLIGSAPYVRALEELVAANKERSTDQPATPETAWAAIRGGQAALAITWAHAAAQSAASPSAQQDGAKPAEPPPPSQVPLAFAQLPGASEVYTFSRQKWSDRGTGEEIHVPLLAVSGRLAALTTTTAAAQDAQDLLVWLSGSEASAIVAPATQATTLFRHSQIPAAARFAGGLDANEAKVYAEALARSSELQRFVSLRLPGRREYLAALDKAVHESLRGEKSPSDSLAAAAATWREITGKYGLPAQQRALRRDLGMESLP
jgi:ABC-type glycerol-3-phosphate transport system substrate-binding protein